MATQTINSRQFLDPSFVGQGEQRMYRQTLTLEMDTSTGVLTLALNGNAVTAVAPHANPALVTISVSGGSASMPAEQFLGLVQNPTGSISTLPPPPARQFDDVFDGWAIARLIQLGVSLDTILRIGARFVSPTI